MSCVDICESVDQSIQAVAQLKKASSLAFLEEAAHRLVRLFGRGGKLLVAGNGGSCCDATHFAEELTGFYREKRRALAAMALADAGHITCVANDVGYEQVFARAIEAYGRPGDLFMALTTSGNSKNLILAIDYARARGLQTIALLGRGGGALKGKADLELIIEGSTSSDRIQEAHMTALHILVELIEAQLPAEAYLDQHLDVGGAQAISLQ